MSMGTTFRTQSFAPLMEDLIKKQCFCFHLGISSMEHYLEGFAPLRHWYINPNEKSNKYKSPLWS